MNELLNLISIEYLSDRYIYRESSLTPILILKYHINVNSITRWKYYAKRETIWNFSVLAGPLV